MMRSGLGLKIGSQSDVARATPLAVSLAIHEHGTCAAGTPEAAMQALTPFQHRPRRLSRRSAVAESRSTENRIPADPARVRVRVDDARGP